MAEIIWAGLVGILKLSLTIIWLPFGLLLKNRDYIAMVAPYLIMGVGTLIVVAFALGLIVSVIRWTFLAIRGFYRGCRAIVAALMPSRLCGSAEYAKEDVCDAEDDPDPYETLGVVPGTTSAEVSRRFRQLMRANHPDKVAQLDPEIQAFASKRARRIIEAYAAVSGRDK